MPKQKTGKPAKAGPRPLRKPDALDPASLLRSKGSPAWKLVAKRGMIPGKSGNR